jgi:glycerol kinase
VQKFESAGHNRTTIKSIGITNQRETTIVWDHETGEPLYNGIVWTDTRSQAIVAELKQKPGAAQLQAICGLPLSTYSSATKLLWMVAHVPKVRDAFDRGTLAFGTVDAWLVYRLNGGAAANVFVSDSTNASRTMFVNLETLRYDESLLDFFGIRGRVHLPRIVPSSDREAYGVVASGVLAGVHIMGCLGDQSAALVGQKGFSPGMAKNTYGTGCFLLYNVGDRPVFSTHGLLATVAYHFGGKPVYALEGSIAVAGSGIKFLQNNLDFFSESKEVNDLASSVKDNGGCVFVTAFSGLFAPYWIDDAKGTICELLSNYLLTIPVSNRLNSRNHPIHPKRPHRTCNPGSNMLPDQSHPRRNGARQWSHPLRVGCRWRHEQLRLGNAGAYGLPGHLSFHK